MKLRLALLAALLPTVVIAFAIPAPALADGLSAYYGSPYPYAVAGPEQHNLTVTSATGLAVPTGTTYAIVQAKTASVNYTLDGVTTPSGTVGITLAAGSAVSLSGAKLIANFQAFSATGTLDVQFFR